MDDFIFSLVIHKAIFKIYTLKGDIGSQVNEISARENALASETCRTDARCQREITALIREIDAYTHVSFDISAFFTEAVNELMQSCPNLPPKK